LTNQHQAQQVEQIALSDLRILCKTSLHAVCLIQVLMDFGISAIIYNQQNLVKVVNLKFSELVTTEGGRAIAEGLIHGILLEERNTRPAEVHPTRLLSHLSCSWKQ